FANSGGVNTSSFERFAMHVNTSGLRPRSEKLAWEFMRPRRIAGIRARKRAYRHRRVHPSWCEDFMLAEVSEERTLLCKACHVSEDVQAKITTLKLALTEVAPLRKRYCAPLGGAHR